MLIVILIIVSTIFLHYTGIIDGYELPKLVGVSMLVGVGVWMLWRKKGSVNLPLLAPISFYILFVALSFFRAHNLYEAYTQFGLDLMGVSIFWYVVNDIKKIDIDKIIDYFLVSVFVMMLISAYYGILDYKSYSIAPPMGNISFTVAVVMLAIPLGLYTIYRDFGTKYRVGFNAIGTFAMVAFLVNAGTDSAVLSLSLSILVTSIVIANRYISKPYLLGIYAIVLLIVLTGLNFNYKQIILKMEPRTAIWLNTTEMVKENSYVLGVGRGNFDLLYPKYSRFYDVDYGLANFHFVNNVHNDYLQLYAEVGLFGFFFFMVVIFGVLKTDMTVRSLALFTSIVSLLVWALFYFPFEQVTFVSLFWILAGLLWVVNNDKEDNSDISLGRSSLIFRGVLTTDSGRLSLEQGGY